MDDGARCKKRETGAFRVAEADNYVEAETSAVGDDAAYDDDEDGIMQRKKKQKLISKVGVKLNKWALRRVKPLERVVLKRGIKRGKRRIYSVTVLTHVLYVWGYTQIMYLLMLLLRLCRLGNSVPSAASRGSTHAIGAGCVTVPLSAATNIKRHAV